MAGYTVYAFHTTKTAAGTRVDPDPRVLATCEDWSQTLNKLEQPLPPAFIGRHARENATGLLILTQPIDNPADLIV